METAQAENLNVQVLATVVEETARNLGPNAVAALVDHPDAVGADLAVVADALWTNGAEKGIAVIESAELRLLHAAETDRRITDHPRMGKKEELLSSERFADRAGLKTRQSVHDWLKKGRIIGWQGCKRGHVFPAGQFDDRGQPFEGLVRIASQVEDGHAAWRWLTAPLPAPDGAEPLALFGKRDTALVAADANGDLQGDFAWGAAAMQSAFGGSCARSASGGCFERLTRVSAPVHLAPFPLQAGSVTQPEGFPCSTRSKRCGAASGKPWCVTASPAARIVNCRTRNQTPVWSCRSNRGTR